VTRYELNVDTGGAGRWRGGLGTIREIEFLEPGGMSLEGDGSVHPPPGLFGGEDGTPGRVEINRRGENGVGVPSKFPYRATQAGDRLYLVAPSGGGYGPAAERDRDAISEDVADEVLSRERARELYGYEE
jgi:N-methylhydantoinase B